MSFVLSLLYNIAGLSFAITGGVKPLTAAIIMPLSTITIVSFVTLMSNYYAGRKYRVTNTRQKNTLNPVPENNSSQKMHTMQQA